MFKYLFSRSLAGMIVLAHLMMACESLPLQSDELSNESAELTLDQSGNELIGMLVDGQFSQIISDADLNAIFQRITPETILETSLYSDSGKYYLKGETHSTRWFLHLNLDQVSGSLKLTNYYQGCSGLSCKCLLVSGECECPSGIFQTANDCDPTSGSLFDPNN